MAKIDVNKLKDRWQTFSILLGIAAVIGLTPHTLKKAATNTNLQIQRAITFRETSFAAIRGGMDLIATGTVEVDGTMVVVEIRKYTGIENRDMWAFVTNGHTEMYEAIWSDTHRTYHYYPAVGNPKHLKNLVYYIKEEE